MIQIKRVYESADPADGQRFLIDRLWPRGLRKDEVPLKAWLKDIAPSNELRQWFHHHPDQWTEFRHRYTAELETLSEALQPLQDAMRHGKVTLLYGSKDVDHNNAVVLKEFLERHSKTKQ
jgi:uncharacterized protein YeaO (DUF488 family)